MAILRLVNGNDVSVKLSVQDTIAAIAVVTGTSEGFVELPGNDGPIHVRPSSIVAVLEDGQEKKAGFRAVGF